MLGTCVAFFVVVGDLGPAILGPFLGVDNPSSIRTLVLTGECVSCCQIRLNQDAHSKVASPALNKSSLQDIVQLLRFQDARWSS